MQSKSGSSASSSQYHGFHEIFTESLKTPKLRSDLFRVLAYIGAFSVNEKVLSEDVDVLLKIYDRDENYNKFGSEQMMRSLFFARANSALSNDKSIKENLDRIHELLRYSFGYGRSYYDFIVVVIGEERELKRQLELVFEDEGLTFDNMLVVANSGQDIEAIRRFIAQKQGDRIFKLHDSLEVESNGAAFDKFKKVESHIAEHFYSPQKKPTVLVIGTERDQRAMRNAVRFAGGSGIIAQDGLQIGELRSLANSLVYEPKVLEFLNKLWDKVWLLKRKQEAARAGGAAGSSSVAV